MESQGVDLEMQRDIPRFYTKFGHILLKKAQMETNPKQRSEYLNDALEQLKKGKYSAHCYCAAANVRCQI